jgi:HEAT repeat protein
LTSAAALTAEQLAQRLIAAVQQIAPPPPVTVVDKNASLAALAAHLASTDIAVRIDALHAIAANFGNDTVDEGVLRAVLKHAEQLHEPGIGAERHACLFAIGRARVPSLLEGFVKMLGDTDDHRVNVAATVLGYAKDRGAVPFLSFIATRNRPQTEEAAAFALGESGDPAAVEPLLALWNSGRSLVTVAHALGQMNSLALVGDLTRGLSADVPTLRVASARAIWATLSMRVPELMYEAREKLAASLVPDLTTALHHSDGTTALFAALSLAVLGHSVPRARVEELLAAAPAGKKTFTDREMFLLTVSGRSRPN